MRVNAPVVSKGEARQGVRSGVLGELHPKMMEETAKQRTPVDTGRPEIFMNNVEATMKPPTGQESLSSARESHPRQMTVLRHAHFDAVLCFRFNGELPHTDPRKVPSRCDARRSQSVPSQDSEVVHAADMTRSVCRQRGRKRAFANLRWRFGVDSVLEKVDLCGIERNCVHLEKVSATHPQHRHPGRPV